MYQISCSTVSQTLHGILNISGHLITSEHGKKKRKLADPKKSKLPSDGIHSGENTLSLLSSLVDILLLKRDIADRFDCQFVCLFALFIYIFLLSGSRISICIYFNHFVHFRDLLMEPLFELVVKSFSDEWIHSILDKKLVQVSDDVTVMVTVSDLKQRLLILLEEMSTSLVGSPLNVCNLVELGDLI